MFNASYKANANTIMNKIICSAKNPTIPGVAFNKSDIVLPIIAGKFSNAFLTFLMTN